MGVQFASPYFYTLLPFDENLGSIGVHLFFLLLSFLILLESRLRVKRAWIGESIRLGLEVIEAEEEVDLDEIQIFKLCLVGKLWTDSSFTTGALQSTIKQIWRLKNGIEIREKLGTICSPFIFSTGKIKKEFFKEPWWFDKKVLVLCEIKGEEQPSALRPCKTPFWVRIHDMPFKLRSEVVVKHIGNIIGEFQEWEMIDGENI